MLTLLALGLLADDAAKASEVVAKLAEHGLKTNAGVAIVTEEVELSKGLLNFSKIGRDLTVASKEYAAFEQRFAQTKADVDAMRAQLTQLRLAYDRNRSNELVNRINLLAEQINAKQELLHDENTGKDVRAKLSKARETYVERVAELRKHAEAAQEKYGKLAKDDAAKAAVASAKEALGKPLELGPSKQFERNLAALEKLEAKTNTAEIELRKEGNTFRVDVLLNGKTATSMVFDTGASSVSIPAAMAREAGLVPTAETPQVRVSIADGRTFLAHRMELESVKVGKFVARNVECIVMPPEHSEAPALLGGAFLNRFNYKMDQGTGKLRLTQLGDEEPPATAKGKTPPKKTVKKKL